MQTLKIIIGILMTALCTWLGYNKSKKYKSDSTTWFNIKEINDKLISNQLLNKDSVIKVINEFDNNEQKYILSKLNNYETNLDISDRDKRLVDSFANSLGKGTSQEQMNLYNNFSKIIEERLSFYKNKELKYSSMCIKLGFLIGVAMFVIII